ncbi:MULTISPECIES: TnsA endonuclease N-terminal domain-containing protein [Burkholderiaceae]|uniref:TnsA endonuclease N-terminal domain-containing protein n=1 Tax=Burkholderiaceae TaxID=119060 RepID=UPI0009DCCD8E|nr:MULTISPECIES: TnsA endonuclease N-terminal domain-containing protein [Burkholderiaceae]
MSGVRKVVTRSPYRRVGLVACPWFQPTAIEYESLLERDFLRLAVLDLEISSISEQPFTMDLGQFGNYTPDFLLVRKHGKTVVEVKPSVHAANPKHSARLEYAGRILADKDYRFLVATEQYIHADKRHERAGVLLRHARSRLPVELTARVLTIASRHPKGIAIDKLVRTAGVPTSTVLHLIGRRQLRISRSLRFDDFQFVYPIGGNDGHLHA